MKADLRNILNSNLPPSMNVSKPVRLATSAVTADVLGTESALELTGGVLEGLFNDIFVPAMNTKLCGGAEEPIYLPASATGALNEIHFTKDYISSALHEIAHWCVAGNARLGEVDYGYWYSPDGRSQAQQSEFERVEVKPQALEWIFSNGCGQRFSVSADNLALGMGPSLAFKIAIAEQAIKYCHFGLPRRAEQWLNALADHFRLSNPLDIGNYQLNFLGV